MLTTEQRDRLNFLRMTKGWMKPASPMEYNETRLWFRNVKIRFPIKEANLLRKQQSPAMKDVAWRLTHNWH